MSRSAQNALKRTLALLSVLALASFGFACGSDSDNGGGTPTSNSDQLDDAVTGLSNFGQGALQDPNFNFLLSEQLQDLAEELFPQLDQIGFSVIELAGAGRLRDAVERSAELLNPKRALAKRDLSDYFGTYDRDMNDVTEPYPGWVLAELGNPSDGLIFRFDGDDDVFLVDDEGNPIQAAGEIRMIDVTITVWDPEGEALEVPTEFVFEIEAGPANGPQVTFFRFDFESELDADSGLPRFVLIGDPDASDPGDDGASFLGPLFFYAFVGTFETTDEFAVGGGLFDASEGYSIAANALLEGWTHLDPDRTPTAMSFFFGFGPTQVPDEPPFEFDIALTNIVEPEDGPIEADVDGSIVFNDETLATIEGDLTQVPVVIDGDTTSCPDIDVTFADDEENPSNICLAIEDLVDLFNLGEAMVAPLTW